MNPSEAWALLTIRSKQFGVSAAGHGRATTSDIAGLLAGLDREPFLMGMAAELGDYNALKQVELFLWERARQIGERENWDPPQGEFTVRRMAGVALYEAIDDRRCYVCNGSAEMTFSRDHYPGMILAPTFRLVSAIAAAVRCPACVGGKVRLSGRKKADLAGINKDTWTRIWAKRYEPIYSIANGWRETAKQYLAARVREQEEEQVDTNPKRASMRAEPVVEKKPSGTGSCDKKSIELGSARREAAPEGNVEVKDLNLGALQRPTLKLNRS